ncbi:hypothetical protein P5W99_30010 [Paraburkholderia sp. A3BS-1L]|uniref:hypothetical protein n=1 Tax=Paraburkholderia sp. A3BS-1L TaxID=3028375 RepID=UPI003DA88803
MIDWLRNLIAYAVFAGAATGLSFWIKSTVVSEILIPNLIPIVIALLAINVQTTAVVAVKLRELTDTHKVSFGASINQFKLALYEQTGLVVMSGLLGAVAKSVEQMAKHDVLVAWGAFFVLTAAVHIFLDTSVGLLMALFPKSE